MRPLFLLGCPRSGTTIIRNYIKTTTRLISPEETSYYRWPFPFGSKEFLSQVNSPLSLKHRNIDGIDEGRFQQMLNSVSSRKDLLLGHVQLMAGTEGDMWFEKTPQHVYAAPLIKADFPDALLVFIFRNPLNACASLYQGRQLFVGSLAGSIAYWKEAFSIYKVLSQTQDGIKLVRYEDFIGSPPSFLQDLIESIDYKCELFPAPDGMVAKKPNQRSEIFTDAERAFVQAACKSEMEELGYL
jgi:LPS sulfotransferase NodH